MDSARPPQIPRPRSQPWRGTAASLRPRNNRGDTPARRALANPTPTANARGTTAEIPPRVVPSVRTLTDCNRGDATAARAAFDAAVDADVVPRLSAHHYNQLLHLLAVVDRSSFPPPPPPPPRHRAPYLRPHAPGRSAALRGPHDANLPRPRPHLRCISGENNIAEEVFRPAEREHRPAMGFLHNYE
jgi:hypothetical protein